MARRAAQTNKKRNNAPLQQYTKGAYKGVTYATVSTEAANVEREVLKAWSEPAREESTVSTSSIIMTR